MGKLAWRAEEGKNYWKVSLDDIGGAEVVSYREYLCDEDDVNHSIGNYFKTKAEAVAVLEKIKVLLTGSEQ